MSTFSSTVHSLRHKQSWLALLVLAILVPPALAQFDDDDPVIEPESAQSKKVFAALELAKMAAGANQPDVSFEAMSRVASTGPVISKVDLGGLLSSPQPGGSISYNSNSNAVTPQQLSASKAAAKMIEVNDLWEKKAFDPGKAYRVWSEHVFPSDSPNVIHLHSQKSEASNQPSYNSFSLIPVTSKPLLKSGAQCLINWATKVEKLDELEKELTKRLAFPGNADLGWLFRLWIADARNAPSEVFESILAEIEPKLSSQIVGNSSELKTHAIREALKKLPANSEFKSRFKKSFLKALPTTSNWNGNPLNMNLLREFIAEAIETKDADSTETIADAVISQWSSLRTNNESWVSSMESQSFMQLAEAAFEKNAFELGSQWMQRVAFGANVDQQGNNWFQLRGNTVQHFLKCPQSVRFEILSKQIWTAPMLGLRDMSSLMPEFRTPTIFQRDTKAPLRQLAKADAASFSALEWLMRDAIALGKQSDIEQKIAALSESKSDDKSLADLIWDKARDKPIDIQRFVNASAVSDGSAGSSASIQRLAPADSPPLPIEVELAELALLDPKTQQLGIEFTTRLLESCLKHGKTVIMSKCRYLLHKVAMSSSKPPMTHERLRHFVEASDWDGGAILDGIPSKPIWVSRNDSLSSWGHETSTMQSYLFLKYPITGDFEIEFKALDGSHAEPGIAIAGIFAEFCPYNKTVALSSLGYRHMGSANKKFEKYKQGKWNQYRIKRSSSDVQIYINGETAVTIPIAESVTPFFGLGSRSFRSSSFDELKITGKIDIPRKVDLCSPRLTGWSSYYTKQWLEPVQLMVNESTTADEDGNSDAIESGQQQAYVFESEQTQNFPFWYGQENGDAAFPWVSKEGVLESVDQKNAREVMLAELETNGTIALPSVRERMEKEPAKPRSIGLIYYQRPLCDGESIELEFYQDSQPELEEGKSRSLPLAISPMIGRTAILLDKPEIALRWIPGEGEKEWSGSDGPQRVIDPQARQLSQAQIKDREWNAMSIRWNNGVALLSINGQDVYERKWETNISPQFGLFHEINQSQVRVRNIRLSGNWPESLPPNLFELLW